MICREDQTVMGVPSASTLSHYSHSRVATPNKGIRPYPARLTRSPGRVLATSLLERFTICTQASLPKISCCRFSGFKDGIQFLTHPTRRMQAGTDVLTSFIDCMARPKFGFPWGHAVRQEGGERAPLFPAFKFLFSAFFKFLGKILR